MKNNKNIASGLCVSILFGFMSASSFAETEQEKMSSDTVVTVNDASSYAKKYSEGQTEVSLIKQELQKAQLMEQIKIIEEKQEARKNENILKQKQKKWDEEKQALISKYEEKIKLLQESSGKSNSSVEDKDDSALDSVFVTRISGIGKSMKARIYINNTIATKGAGEFVGDNIKIISVHEDGIKISHKGASKFVPITTINRAQYKSFEQNESSSKDLQDSQNKTNGLMSAPNGMSSGMPGGMPINTTPLPMM